MFYLKESNGIDSDYIIIDKNETFLELKIRADRRYSLYERRWVIVDQNDDLLSYSDNINYAVKNHIKYFRRNNKLRIEIQDKYVIKILKKEKIPLVLNNSLKNIFVYGNKSDF